MRASLVILTHSVAHGQSLLVTACSTLPAPEAKVWPSLIPWDPMGQGTAAWNVPRTEGLEADPASAVPCEATMNTWWAHGIISHSDPGHCYNLKASAILTPKKDKNLKNNK